MSLNPFHQSFAVIKRFPSATFNPEPSAHLTTSEFVYLLNIAAWLKWKISYCNRRSGQIMELKGLRASWLNFEVEERKSEIECKRMPF